LERDLSDLRRILALLQGRSSGDMKREVHLTTIYLSPDNPRWTPQTEADLQAAIDGGLIEESSYLDAKRELASKSDNRELARDLASFANEGGTLLIGIDEDKSARTFSLAPQPLGGLAERVDQVARSIPDPPISVVIKPIPSNADTSHGYLVVHVPMSPQAPHMVDGKYHGRGDTTKHILRDPDVARLHARRRSTDEDVLAILSDEMKRDPLGDIGEQSHLFLVAQPIAGRRDMLLDFTSAPDWNLKLAHLVQKSYTPEVNQVLQGNEVHPELLHASNSFRRSGGVARATPNLGQGRIWQPERAEDEDVVELQVFEDGGLRLYFSRFSDHMDRAGGQQVVLDAAAPSLARRLVAVVEEVADITGHQGAWSFAVGASRLKGRVPYSMMQSWGTSYPSRYDRDDYHQATAATRAELATAPGGVVNRMVGPLLRGFGVHGRYSEILSEERAG
jgi:hypothetical protein